MVCLKRLLKLCVFSFFRELKETEEVGNIHYDLEDDDDWDEEDPDDDLDI